MNIFLSELYKVWGKKAVWGFLLLLGMLNVAALFYVEQQKGYLFRPQEYRALYEKIENCPEEEAVKRLENELEKDGNSFAEMELVEKVLKEVRAVVNYDTFLEETAQRAKSIGQVSIFSQKDSFSYRNNVKTAEAYEGLTEIDPKVGSYQCIEVWAGFIGTDVIAVVLLVYVVFVLTVKEKETGQLMLSFATRNGRRRHGVAKIAVCFCSAAGVVLFLWGTSLLVTGLLYGCGKFGNPIQSVYAFRTCTLKVSVGGFLAFFLLLKIVSLFFIMLLVYGIACGCKSYVWLYIGVFGILGIEFFLLYSIPANSHLSVLRFINLMAVTNADTVIGTYFNVRILGQPVWYLPLYCLFVATGTVLLLFWDIRRYAGQKSLTVQGKRNGALKKTMRMENVSLIRHECYKTLFSGKVIWILLGVAIFQLVTYKPMGEYFEKKDDIYYKNYMITLEGMYSEEKEDWLKQEEEKFADAIRTGNVSVLERSVAFERVKEHAAYLKENGGAFLYDTGYRLLTNDKMASGRLMILLVIANLLLVLCVAGLYSNEYQSGMIALVRCSARGRKDTFLSKALIGVLLALIVWGLIFLPFLYKVFSTYGTAGLDFPACSMEHLKGIGMSVRQYLRLLYGFLCLSLVLETFAIMGISKVMKSNSLTALVSVGVFVMPLLFFL